MTKLVTAFALGIFVGALVTYTTHGRIESQTASQIAPLQMMTGQHPPPQKMTDYSVVFESK